MIICLAWGYVAPRRVTAGLLAMMMMFPPLVFQVGIAFGAEGEYVSVVVFFCAVSLLLYVYGLAGGATSLGGIDILLLTYTAAIFLVSLVVSHAEVTLSHLAMFVRVFFLPIAFFFAGRLFFSHPAATHT